MIFWSQFSCLVVLNLRQSSIFPLYTPYLFCRLSRMVRSVLYARKVVYAPDLTIRLLPIATFLLSLPRVSWLMNNPFRSPATPGIANITIISVFWWYYVYLLFQVTLNWELLARSSETLPFRVRYSSSDIFRSTLRSFARKGKISFWITVTMPLDSLLPGD